MMRLACLLLVVTQLACSARRTTVEPPRPTCVVLSVGGSAGLAHLGAMDALRERGVPIACVVGNSMGSLVGSLYATAPDENLRERYRAFIATYAEKSRSAAAGRGTVGGIAGAGVGLLLGGPIGLLALLGAGLGAVSTPEVSHKRFEAAIDEFYDHASIEQTVVPFVTFYLQPRDQGVELIAASSGNLAQAVAASAANPFIFPDIDVRDAQRLDPGGDRASAVPVQDACDLFPGHRLIVINVTGRSALYSRDLPCPIHEIRVDVRFPRPQLTEDGEEDREARPEVEAISGHGEAFDVVYQAGYAAVMAQSSL
jgi:NTE family protein